MKPILFYQAGDSYNSVFGHQLRYQGIGFESLNELEQYVQKYEMKNCWFTYEGGVYVADKAGFKAARATDTLKQSAVHVV